ncbi:MAG TPA: RNA-directed DNA polymerase [Methanothrix soehngenii]|nr:RNA-directed DNA polymerase [Methanothrix soehngenii]
MIDPADLIRFGYFPKELPPPFTTDHIANHVPLLLSIIPQKLITSRCCRHSIPKVKNLRRDLKIPNPQNQLRLCEYLSNNWPDIEAFFQQSAISLSIPIKDTKKRAVRTKTDIKDIYIELLHRSIGCSYRLHVDISNYYSNMYTHSIPWAYYGKKFAKVNRHESLLANKIDKMIQSQQDGQTLGIPIGPDTSLIISEIVGAAIDIRLAEEFPNLKGGRYIDDYFLYFEEKEQANAVLRKLHEIISDFELNINREKTEISELPDYLGDIKWRYELSMYSFKNDSESQLNRIIDYFNKAFEYSKQYPEDYVLRYALGRIKQLKVYKENWPIYESFLLHAITAEPSVISIATNIFYTYKKNDYNLAIDKISHLIDAFIKFHCKYHHHNEIAWALWLSKMLEIKINDVSAKCISQIMDSIIVLIALDLNNNGLITNGLDKSNWIDVMSDGQLYDDNWLLCYEANVKGWLHSRKGKDYIAKDKFFSYLRGYNIQFYDVNKKSTIYELKEEQDGEPDEYIKLTYI